MSLSTVLIGGEPELSASHQSVAPELDATVGKVRRTSVTVSICGDLSNSGDVDGLNPRAPAIRAAESIVVVAILSEHGALEPRVGQQVSAPSVSDHARIITRKEPRRLSERERNYSEVLSVPKLAENYV
jgi:hypothetical protein